MAISQALPILSPIHHLTHTTIITNPALQPVWAFTVCWRGVSQLDGLASRHYVLSLETTQDRPVLPAGTSRHVHPNEAQDDQWWRDHYAVTAELDAAVLADLTVHGPNYSKLLLRFTASTNAERDLLLQITLIPATSQSFESTLRAALITLPTAQPTMYATLYSRERTTTAQTLLHYLTANGPAALALHAASLLSSGRFPTGLPPAE